MNLTLHFILDIVVLLFCIYNIWFVVNQHRQHKKNVDSYKKLHESDKENIKQLEITCRNYQQAHGMAVLRYECLVEFLSDSDVYTLSSEQIHKLVDSLVKISKEYTEKNGD